MADTITAPDSAEERLEYRTTEEVMWVVVQTGDGSALDETVTRPMFAVGSDRHALAGYLNALRQQALERTAWKRAPAEADKAYDLTLDRFFGRAESDCTGGKQRTTLPASATCRGYYRTFLTWATPRLSNFPSRLERESRCQTLFQGFVKRQFAYACREAARRALPFLSRYQWTAAGQSLCLYMPVTMTGADRRRWLEEHVTSVNTDHPGERERIQALIDSQLNFGSFVPLDDVRYQLRATGHCCSPAAAAMHRELADRGLTETVALEKSRCLEEQRPRIRSLGREGVYSLVRRILKAIGEDTYNEAEIALEFGISKATVSRFAGKHWLRDTDGTGGRIPDLWENMASVLAGVPEFVEAAREAGVWPRIATIAKPPNR